MKAAVLGSRPNNVRARDILLVRGARVWNNQGAFVRRNYTIQYITDQCPNVHFNFESKDAVAGICNILDNTIIRILISKYFG